MQIRIKGLYRAAHEAVRRTTHAFAAPAKGIGIDHSHVFRLRPRRCPTKRKHTKNLHSRGQNLDVTAMGNLCCRYPDVFLYSTAIGRQQMLMAFLREFTFSDTYP